MTGRRSSLPAAVALLGLCGCAAPLRTLSSVPPGREGCATLERFAEEKAKDAPQREGESSALDDSLEAAACYRRENDLARARGALLPGLVAELTAGARGEGTGGFDDALARKVAAIALSANAAGDAATFERAKALLTELRGRELTLERGDRRAVGRAGEAVSMLDANCFFCARSEAYGAQDGEHVEELGRFAGAAYVRRDDGREQFLVATRLIAEGQKPPAVLFAEAMRRRGRTIQASSPASLARREPGPSEEASSDAPLFHLALHGFAFGDVARAEQEAGKSDGLHLIVRSDAGDLVVRFPPLLLTRAGRDRRFVAPPDGVDAVVRYEGREGDRPRYRAVILRHEDGIAEGP